MDNEIKILEKALNNLLKQRASGYGPCFIDDDERIIAEAAFTYLKLLKDKQNVFIRKTKKNID